MRVGIATGRVQGNGPREVGGVGERHLVDGRNVPGRLTGGGSGRKRSGAAPSDGNRFRVRDIFERDRGLELASFYVSLLQPLLRAYRWGQNDRAQGGRKVREIRTFLTPMHNRRCFSRGIGKMGGGGSMRSSRDPFRRWLWLARDHSKTESLS